MAEVSVNEKGALSNGIADSALKEGSLKSNNTIKLRIRNIKWSRLFYALLIMASDILLIVFVYFIFFPPEGVVQNINHGLATTPLKSQSPADPQPFFNGSNFVEDFYGGNVFDAFVVAQKHHDAFIMFYAPWDVDCIRARYVFEELAKVFVHSHNDIYFGAVNCWTNDGDCYKEFGNGNKNIEVRSRFTFTQQLPIFIYYPKDRDGIQYFGPITEHYMAQFMLNVQKPIQVIGSENDLLSLRAKSNGIALVGYFPNLSPLNISLNYKKYLKASYLSLEEDPFRYGTGPFVAVVSQTLATQLDLNCEQSIKFFYWNSTSVAYPNKTITSSKLLLQWTQNKSAFRLTSWIGTMGIKSLNLANKLKTGSKISVLAFFPRTVDSIYNIDLSIFQQIAMEYFSCDFSKTNPLVETKRLLRIKESNDFATLIRHCNENELFRKTFCVSKKKSCVCQNYSDSIEQNQTFDNQTKQELKTPYSNVIKNDNYKRLECALAGLNTEKDCSLWTNTPEESDLNEMQSLKHHGIGCDSNKSINFFTLDSLIQQTLALSLGVKLNQHTSPNVLLVDMTDETVYEMKEDYNYASLSRFIDNYWNKKADISKLLLSSSSSIHQTKISDQEIHIMEVNSENFHSVALNASQQVILLYHASSCGMCASFSYVFHTVYHLLSPIKNLTFATVDASLNDLPWHFTDLVVPSILFFPMGNKDAKAETRVFPSEKSISIPNLINFILANLTPEDRLQLSLSLCDQDCLTKSKHELSQRITQEVNSEESLNTLNYLNEKLSEEFARRNKMNNDIHLHNEL